MTTKTNFPKAAGLLSALLLLVFSCSTPSLAERMDSLAETLSQQDVRLSSEDYEAYLDEYSMLLGEFEANLSSYSTEERNQILYNIGRINGALLHNGGNSILGGILGGLSALPNLLNGFQNGLDWDNLPMEDVQDAINELRNGLNL